MKPDITEFRKHQDAYKSQIDDIQGKLQIVRQKISNASANGPAHERRKALFKELDEHKSSQAGNRASRDKVLERVRVLHESTQRKVRREHMEHITHSHTQGKRFAILQV